MSENGTSVESWFYSLADEALARNYKSECTWTKYKDDLEETKKILSWLPVKLKHDVMVPIGRKALMRGKMVHTNELLVSLGDTWFVKRSASQTVDVCKRRIHECDQMLEKLKKERELLENKKSLPDEKEAFGSVVRPEIIEYVSEEEHQEWKKQHKVKEREYRQKLTQLKNKRKKIIETEEDLWNHLDELELHEELEDELNRLNEAAYDDEDEDEDEGENNENDENETVESIYKKEPVKELRESFEHGPDENVSCADCSESNLSKNNDEGDGKNPIKSRKLTVSFAVDIDNSSDCEPLLLEIKHSPVEPAVSIFQGVINSPADIYQAYLKTIYPKSNLKCNVNMNQEKEFEAIANENKSKVEFNFSSGIDLPDVFAKNALESGSEFGVGKRVSSFKEPPKRISKFKASRMKKS